jgi:UDP-glucose:glycoprotein glucosyltransferase
MNTYISLRGPRPTTSPFDRVSTPFTGSGHLPAVLYYDPTSRGVSALVSYLQHHATTTPGFQYIVRYRPSRTKPSRTGLSGYGVEMALKKTDYLVVDDRASGRVAAHVNVHDSEEEGIFAATLGEDPWSEMSTPLTSKEITCESICTPRLTI